MGWFSLVSFLVLSQAADQFRLGFAELVVKPKDTEAVYNQSTYLNCSTSLEPRMIQWKHGASYVYAWGKIYDSYSGRFQVEINNSTGACNLFIPSVERGDAGQYTCIDQEGIGDSSSSQLIVLESDPICHSSAEPAGIIGPNACGLEPETLLLSCTVGYYGNSPPLLGWRRAGETDFISAGLTNQTSKDLLVYNLSMTADVSMEGAAYVCQSKRLPSSQHNCTTGVTRVLYSFGSDVQMNISIGEEVTCSANSSQSCLNSWKLLDGDDKLLVANGSSFTPNKTGTYICESDCALGEEHPCTVQSMVIYVDDMGSESESVSGSAWIWLLLLVVLALAGLLGYFLYRRHKRADERSREKRIGEPDPANQDFLLRPTGDQNK